MLQLTQTDNGQINGVLNLVELKPDGDITSQQSSVAGFIDADQLTLNVGSGLDRFLEGKSIAGRVKASCIQLEIVDSKGNVTSEAFDRGSAGAFKSYADQLKSKGEGIVLSRRLTDGAQNLRQTVKSAEEWIATAELHAQRIPNAKSDYQQIEDRMQSLVSRERATPNSVARSQISVIVSQADITGDQTDIQVDQLWDINIGSPGSNLQNEFAKWEGNCGGSSKLRMRGATESAVDAWESACTRTLAERAKFGPIYKRIMERRAELKAFQATAQAHRKAMVQQADRMENSID